MCGRMSRLFDAKEAEKQKKFMITKIEREFGPSYNVAPSQQIPVITPGSRILTTMKWGLIPHWAKNKKIGNYNINARSETITDKASFRENFKKRRCLILTSGFMEWDKSKTPHHIQIKDEKIFALAGLWDSWKDKETGEIIESCTIITCPPNSFMKKIHHRMPVILNEKLYEEWLTSEDLDLIQRLLKSYTGTNLIEYKLDKIINNTRNNSPEVLDKVAK
jgi:putative SOS response-associated peptidase YedK